MSAVATLTLRPPTDPQLALLRLIAARTAADGYPPGLRDLAAVLGVNTNAVHYALGRLADAGLVRWVPNLKRTLRLTVPGALVAGGWAFGPSPAVRPFTLEVDAEAAAGMTCGHCRSRAGLVFVPMHKPRDAGDPRHGGYAHCPRCGGCEEF
jgi:SOS-response transcriptional repressor LexA